MIMIEYDVAQVVKGRTAKVNLMHSNGGGGAGSTTQLQLSQKGKQHKLSQEGNSKTAHFLHQSRGKQQAQTSCSAFCSAEQVNWRCCSRALHSANDWSSAPALRDHTTPSLERSSCNTFWAMRSIQPAMSSQPLSHCCRLVKNCSTNPEMLRPL